MGFLCREKHFLSRSIPITMSRAILQFLGTSVEEQGNCIFWRSTERLTINQSHCQYLWCDVVYNRAPAPFLLGKLERSSRYCTLISFEGNTTFPILQETDVDTFKREIHDYFVHQRKNVPTLDDYCGKCVQMCWRSGGSSFYGGGIRKQVHDIQWQMHNSWCVSLRQSATDMSDQYFLFAWNASILMNATAKPGLFFGWRMCCAT